MCMTVGMQPTYACMQQVGLAVRAGTSGTAAGGEDGGGGDRDLGDAWPLPLPELEEGADLGAISGDLGRISGDLELPDRALPDWEHEL